ncbi:MAG: aldehyde dehydrogenase family protein, partial [Rhodobacteraceae bacterium]|nr:aldehyde dehydrogenase family protein [Paracoccaceae bacterium]
NSGQSCNAPTRMLVERAIYDQAVETARTIAEKTEVGPADIEGRQIGPVVSEVQFNSIQYFLKHGIDEGARLVAGGLGKPDGLTTGHFVRPTLFADVTPDMTIWREEIFGPVLTMTPFDTEEEAIELGMVEMNGKFGGAGSPFGGMKHSGNGREGGTWGLEEFLEVKAVSDWE